MQPSTETSYRSYDITTLNKSQETPCTFDKSPPLAHATAKRGRDGVWGWTVAVCPHCGQKHAHGGGDGEFPAFLGHRVSHCRTGRNAGYILVEMAK